MISLPESVLQLLDSGLASIRGLMRFDFGTGVYGFTTMSRPFLHGGLTYLPGGIIKAEDIAGGLGFEASGLTITLAEAPEDGLTPEILSRIELEDYHQRPVTISDAYFHPDSGALLIVEPVYRGYVDTVRHDAGTEPGLVIQCESRALDNARTGYRLRSTADHQSMWAEDRFYEHAEVAGKQELFWGRDKPK